MAFAFLLVLLAADPASAGSRTLRLYFGHTGESGDFTYKKNGRYDRAELKHINKFLRDWRAEKAIEMDPKVLDLLWEVHRKSGSRERIHIVSAYRSPKTNATLRKRGRGVAKFSQHMRGKAIDFYIPGVPVSKIRKIGLRMQVGGVGYYPTSGSPFVHLDTGSVRHWPRMTRKQLAAVFPSGETLHIPSDGKPLQGYNRALAKSRTGKAATQVAARDTKPRSTKPQSSKPVDIRPARIPERTRPEIATPTIVASNSPASPRRWLNRVLRRGSEPVERVAPPAPTTDVATMVDSEGKPVVPRARPNNVLGTELPTETLMAGIVLPRIRPDGTPFDVTPEERRARSTLAFAMGDNAVRAGAAGVDDALSGLYATADYDSNEWLRGNSTEDTAIELAANSDESADMSEEADDALSTLYAFAGSVGPTKPDTVPAKAEDRIVVTERAGSPAPDSRIRPEIVTSSLAPHQAGTDDASVGAATDGAPKTRKWSMRSALSVATIFGKPGQATGADDARDRARKSLIQLAYAAPLEPDWSASDLTAEVRASAIANNNLRQDSQRLRSDRFQPVELKIPQDNPGPAPVVAGIHRPDVPVRLPQKRPTRSARAAIVESAGAESLAIPSHQQFADIPDPLALSRTTEMRLRKTAAPHKTAGPSNAYRRAALVARLMNASVLTRFAEFADFAAPRARGVPELYVPRMTDPQASGIFARAAAVAHLPRTDRFTVPLEPLRGHLPHDNPLRLVSR